MILKGQTAISTPFDPSGTSLVSTDTESAIKEVLNASFDSSKAFLLAQYGGNAIVGRYLEFFSGIASDAAPIRVINPYKGITIVARSTAVSTGDIDVLDITVPASPIVLYTITYTATDTVIVSGSPVSPIFTSAANARIALRVSSGSIQKPHLYIIGQGG